MTKPPDFDALVDALRCDMPEDAERERVRARLLAAGVAVGAGIVAPSSAAAAAQVVVAPVANAAVASGAQASLLAHATGMSLSAKLGVLAVVVAAGASVPVARQLYERPAHAARAGVQSQAHAPIATAVPRADQPALPRALAPVAQEPAQTAAQLQPVQPQAAQPQAAVIKRRAGATTPPTVASTARPQPASTAAEPTAALATLTPEPRTAATAASPSTLHDEADLLGRALAALRANDREGARAALAAHEQRYPHGMLERERDRVLQRIDAAAQPVK